MKKVIVLLALVSTAVFASSGSLTTKDTKANEQELKIEVTRGIISVNGKRIANTSTVAKQDSLLIGTLYGELQSKRKTIKNNKVQIHSEPNMYYDVFFKIITTASFSGFTDISYTSKINGKYQTENINLLEKGTRSIQPSDNNLNLTVAISKDYLEIWARGGSLPKIFYKECNDGKKMNLCVLHKESEEDPGIIEMSVYNKSDSAYIDSNNEFITSLSDIGPGSIVATLSESSARRLACGKSAAGVEDICGSDGRPTVTLRPRSAYDELAKYLMMIHNRFIDSPDADKINIIADDDMAISKVLQIHHEAKTAGFWKINFSKLVVNYPATGGFDEGSSSGSGGAIGTKSKGSLKAPSARDIDMGNGDASRSKQEIMQVINARMPGLRNIHNKYLKLKPDFNGKVTLKFTIAPSGDIVSISIVSSTTGYSEFDEDIKNMVATWKWKTIKSGNTTPTIPFNFTE